MANGLSVWSFPVMMEVRSCSIQITYFRIWYEENGYFVEDMNYKQKIFLSLSLLRWFEASLVELLHLLDQSFVHKKDRGGLGVIRLSKFRSFRQFF